MNKTLIFTALFTLPLFASAQSLQTIMSNTLLFINNYLIPFIFGIAFVIFVFNMVRYFVLGAGNSDIQEDAKSIIFYSIGAFVFIIIFWGIINLVIGTIGIDGSATDVRPDYLSH